MPLYDYQCNKCTAQWEQASSIEDRHKSVCPKCGAPGHLALSVPKTHLFREGIYEHITTKPLYIRTKRELVEACKKHGVQSTYYM